MKLHLCIVVILFNLGCSGQSDHSVLNPSAQKETATSKNPGISSLAAVHMVKASENYASVKKSISTEREQLISKDLTLDSLGRIFKTSLLNKILPFWEGTEWSFEGHTSQPRVGKIACGYFVSTTLQDIGLQVNRYALAQKSPIDEAKILAVGMEVKEFSEPTTLKNIAAIKEYLKEGIHFIGFDQSHVGYVLKEKGDLYLIHSNYIGAAGVQIERMEQSGVFKSYGKFFIVELSTNESLLEYWVAGKEIKIH